MGNKDTRKLTWLRACAVSEWHNQGVPITGAWGCPGRLPGGGGFELSLKGRGSLTGRSCRRVAGSPQGREEARWPLSPQPWCGLKGGRGGAAEATLGTERRQGPLVDQGLPPEVGQGPSLLQGGPEPLSLLGQLQGLWLGAVAGVGRAQRGTLSPPCGILDLQCTGWERGRLGGGSSLLKSEATDLSCPL